MIRLFHHIAVVKIIVGAALKCRFSPILFDRSSMSYKNIKS